ncbi:sodium/proline symporter [Dysosmobacter sp. NSJ-60]|uniref:Sodium/proline symporter n=1 Tax=Pusillibacter faecalis TaxID=2714358 RepID=A0A810QBF2_9FIRM|nr:sodium/proline symporter [Pusillibacter faecalis]MBC5748065.1 sodium/proline symporter [Dysosmobacter hominis]MBS5658743.1 sodium/proline symporter [Oscillibacter sp.]MCQ5026076.1 sodium/proline symporter [Oscillibacter valericigenes]BCK85579.1 sodium:proline symporter [Pusillibacter faecalis]
MTTSQLCICLAIVAYLAVMLGIGIWCAKKNNSVDDFYLGGRKLGPFVTAMSAEASDMSSWLLMGLPGVAYLSGLAEASWTAIGLAVGTYLNWLIVARRIRRYSHRLGAITVPQFFSKRWKDERNLLSAIAAVVIIVFFIPYLASGFSACGKLFASLFGTNYLTAMIISGAVIVIYTVTGGFLAASFTDLVQSIIMTVALLIILIFATGQAGGMDAVISNAQSLTGYLSLSNIHDPATGGSSPYGLLTIFSLLAWGLGYFGMPHILLRFMAIEDEKKLSLSRRVATTWVVISMGVAVFIGLVGNAMTANGTMEQLADSETIIVQISSLLSQYGIPAALLAGVILAGILAATMSTADSQLLAASSSVSQNLFAEFFGVKFTAKQGMLVARGTMVVISLVAMFLARDPNSSVFRVVSFAWAGFGAAFGPVVLFALFWRRSNQWGALAGMLAGGAMVFIWKYLIAPMGGAWAIYELLPAFIVASIAIVVVSLLTAPPEQSVTETFDAVGKQAY